MQIFESQSWQSLVGRGLLNMLDKQGTLSPTVIWQDGLLKIVAMRVNVQINGFSLVARRKHIMVNPKAADSGQYRLLLCSHTHTHGYIKRKIAVGKTDYERRLAKLTMKGGNVNIWKSALAKSRWTRTPEYVRQARYPLTNSYLTGRSTQNCGHAGKCTDFFSLSAIRVLRYSMSWFAGCPGV